MSHEIGEFVSLDIETTADDQKGSIISIALVKIASREEKYFEIDLSKGFWGRPAAFMVNGFNPGSMVKGEVAGILDYPLSLWLAPNSIAMGRGISYFDMGYVQRDLPLIYARFNRRVFDLWGYVFGLSLQLGIEPSILFDKAKTYAAEKLKSHSFELGSAKFDKHHALYDAWENVYVLDFLKTNLNH